MLIEFCPRIAYYIKRRNSNLQIELPILHFQLFLGRCPRLVQLPQRELSNLDVLYCTFYSSCHCLNLNHLIIIGSTFHTLNVDAKNKFQYDDFISLIATKSGEQDKYRRKWDFIQNVLSHSPCHVVFSLLYINTAVKTKNDLM